MKTSEKKFVFCEAFLILKKYFSSNIRIYFDFYKKGFLNSQAVRIRVNNKICIYSYSADVQYEII
jgi:hypothetical protein